MWVYLLNSRAEVGGDVRGRGTVGSGASTIGIHQGHRAVTGRALHAVGEGPRPATRRYGVIETLGEIWIWNGSWEPTLLLVMKSIACWAVTFVTGSIFARLVRLEIWKVTNTWVPFSLTI